ncbi:LysM peptidoglycan-binding domain-containing protein [Nitratireductor sp. ZSWI3]|uniref:LysM peptidoglycan-binding domain-containing protein n=1 Tax=Nitratireductor sp. ZSWI3 TaxID=2966359 RepID=UPI0021506B40|nr:LysM peptidoglycan-binding domain-containing protein [Nitratireductor sp. ZSWI3]MCR4266871.1 LysM peptidoglycan-binding domain-containing protein [Nitratireductor sp. ZSWI3]
MGSTPLKGLLFAAGAVVAGIGTAYLMGAFDSSLETPPAAVSGTPQTAPKQEASGGSAPADGQKDARLSETASEPATPAADPTPPSFDLVRVEPDGSMVVAGHAAPDARIEIVHGATVLGTATSGPNGDFAAVLDEPLPPGDYQIVLRATTPDNIAATSVETAIVTVPDDKNGQVLALVDRPGAPSKLITVPEAKPAGTSAAAGTQGPAEAPAGQSAGAAAPPSATPPAEAAGTSGETPASASADREAPEAAAEPPAQEQASAPTPGAAPDMALPHIEAVEIDGRQVFVAGSAAPGSLIRVYANEILLGETLTEPNGRFLIEAVRDLPVGDYIIRADMMSPDGATVIARAAVPFTRAEGEQLAAVAQPAQPDQPAPPVAKTDRLAAEGGGEASADQVAGDSGAGDAAAEPATAPKLEPVDGSVIIRRGDTLWQISRRVYGRGIRYTTIYLANQEQITDPDRIWPGQVFAVPEKTEEGEPADMEALGAPSSPVEPAR